MYERYYGFEKKPFSISPDPDFLYLNATYKEAMALLRYGVYEVRGIVSLIGEVGTGKTMLLNELLTSFDDQVTAFSIPTAQYSHGELIDYLLGRLGVSASVDKNLSRFEVLRGHLEVKANRNETVVLLVDEAQTLDRETLESLRLLSNIETPKRKLLPILLVGQPELQDKLDLPELRQLKQRIVVSFRLRALSYDEVPQYIAHRLKGAGYDHGLTLFSGEAVQLIADYSGGIPRLVNALCDNALLSGYARNRQTIDVSIIEESANDLLLDKGKADSPSPKADGPVATPPPASHVKAKFYDRWFVWAAAALLIAIIGGYVAVSYKAQFGAPSVEQASKATDVLVQPFAGRSSVVDSADIKTRHSERVGAPSRVERAADESPTMAKAVAILEKTRREEKKDARPTPFSTTVQAVEYPSAGSADGASINATVSGATASARSDDSNVPDGTARVLSAGSMHTGSVESSEQPGSPYQGEPTVSSDNARTLVEAVNVDRERPRVMERDRQSRAGSLSVAEKKTPEKRGTIRTIQQGQTISSIARELYGRVRLYELALIHAANPDITNLDVLMVGQSVFFPDLAQEIIVFNQDNGSYGIVLGAARSQATIKKWQADLVAKGIASNVVSVRLSNSIRAYRLEAGKFKDEQLALQEAGVLRPSFKMTIAASMEERL